MKKYISFPSPLTIAFILTCVVFIFALWNSGEAYTSLWDGISNLSLAWYNGLWDTSAGGLYFAFQMIFILVFGHVLALTPVFNNFINGLTHYCTNSSSTAITISATAVVLGHINWGLALVLSALMVKHVLQKFHHQKQSINIGLVGASAYVSMLVWHGGLSGSSPTKAMEQNAIRDMLLNAGYQVSDTFPTSFPASETIFSPLNLTVFLTLLITIPLLMSLMARRLKKRETLVPQINKSEEVDQKRFEINTTTFIGILFLTVAIWVAIHQTRSTNSGFLNINFINFCLLGLGILLHNDLTRFTEAIRVAIGDAAGVLIQFPFYFGIIGLMKASGLTEVLSDAMVSSASVESFPVLAFLSAGLLNFFIPSGGGQFYIQGPMLIEAAQTLGVDVSKTIMALSYGDQWTNMLQPFWALPLLGITKIKLIEILPYCAALFLLSGVVFITALMFF
jgi:short-chain fatty acids transporter